MSTKTERIRERVTQTEERLTAYRARELEMLNGGVQSYGVGTRNLTRYNTDLAAVRDTIAELENKLDELYAQLGTGSPRKAVAVVPRDW
ncbi:MAG: hypothetical protein VB078_00055 [Clostridiaceae bacterium]|nr:hypothetical protein [Clostridiaceae bacterium]DAM37298.1 MAG TPA: head to tail adaptor [Caudoviricetes sp.]